jgi:hypothetical protein
LLFERRLQLDAAEAVEVQVFGEAQAVFAPEEGRARR